MHILNDNPVEAEELGRLRAQRTRTAPVLSDLPLIVLSRGLPEDSSPAGRTGEEEHNRDQAALVALSRTGKQVVAKQSGHHIPLDEPDLVVAAVRDVLAAAPNKNRAVRKPARRRVAPLSGAGDEPTQLVPEQARFLRRKVTPGGLLSSLRKTLTERVISTDGGLLVE
jgi:hypothetical protein